MKDIVIIKDVKICVLKMGFAILVFVNALKDLLEKIALYHVLNFHMIIYV